MRLAGFLFLLPTLLSASFLWWEAESPKEASEDFSTSHWFDARSDSLSGGLSLGSNKSSASTRLRYELELPQEGTWHFYVRKFWKHGPFRFRWNGGPWQELENQTLLDSVKLNKHSITWMPGGIHELPAGKLILDIEAQEKWGPFVLDCFVLSERSFTPLGLRRPGEKLGKADPGTWAFEPDPDPVDAPDLLGLRAMNETRAGMHGRVRMDADGNFRRGDGLPLRFWGVNTSIQHGRDLQRLQNHARFLARRGVNLWRHHGHFNPGPDEDARNINEENLRAFHRGIAAMKAEGIYACLSPYWATHSIEVGAEWGLDGIEGRPAGTLFWEPRLQELYKHWIREALTRPNPFDPDKLPLKDDPALAIFQIQNEDSLLFWTAQHIKGRERERLTQRYHTWRKQNGLTGTPELNLKFWTIAEADQDLKDTLHFFMDLQRDWNTELARFLREEVGYTGLINAGNWRTAHQAKLLDAERWSYSANEVIGVNRYVNGGSGRASHVNPTEAHKSGYQVNRGDFFQDESVLHHPNRFPLALRQVPGKAMIVPESTWVQPMSYQSEAPFLIAAYASLLDIDAFMWFSLGQEGYDPGLVKWQVATPDLLGGFPAAALLYRRGDLSPAPPALVEPRNLSSLWNLESALLPEEAGFDPNRDRFNAESGRSALDPLLYLVGPVLSPFTERRQAIERPGEQFIQRPQQRVLSPTRQLLWQYHEGYALINSPRAQGATGFLKSIGDIKLGDLLIQVNNDYATLLCVSLDGKTLPGSRRVLLQVTTRSRPHGWKAIPDQEYQLKEQTHRGWRIESMGEAPWNVEKADVRFQIRNPALKQIQPLNANLLPEGDPLPLSPQGIQLPTGYLYFLLTP